MSEINLEQVVIIGWNNFTASLAEGIKNKFPSCTILCPDPITPDIQETQKYGYLTPIPPKQLNIYANTQFVIINQDPASTFNTLNNIKHLLGEETYIIDFQPVKSPYFEKTLHLLNDIPTYVSCFVFLDEIPENFTVRSDLFKDKIVAVVSNTSTQILQEVRDFWNIFQAKIVPTSAEFFDEILAETSQSVSLLSHILTHVLLQDSWADTLFFGFYNKLLRSFLDPACIHRQCSSESIINNADNIRRTLSFIKREINKIDHMIDEEDAFKLSQYLQKSYQFKNRI
ncbi:MAG: hypothetical protein ACRCWI_02080 [Brevinema sp.]